MNDRQFRLLLDEFGLSWSGYRKVRKGVKRRIRRHMGRLGCHTVDSYLAVLASDTAAREACQIYLTVSISRFFRDRELWDVLQSDTLPKLIEQRPETVRVWFGGCASGEEVYSLKIVWEALGSVYAPLPGLAITATDLNPSILIRAQAGRYPPSSLRELPAPLKNHCFRHKPDQNRYMVKHRLKQGIDWRAHDLLSAPPGDGFNLIFLRNNLLTYYRESVTIPAGQRIAAALADDGFLVAGSHEKPPASIGGLRPQGGLAYLFQKKGNVDIGDDAAYFLI